MSMHRAKEITLVKAHLVLETEEARPAAEDEGVVRGENGDDVNTLRLELVVLLEERREMVRVARRLHEKRHSECDSLERSGASIKGWSQRKDLP